MAKITHPYHVTQVFGIPVKEADLDFFDTNLKYDSLLFLDPTLIKNSPIAEERRLFSRFDIYFKNALKISLNAKTDAKSKKDLLRYLSFPEPKEIYLGYTRKSNEGKGLAGTFARALYEFFMSGSAKKFLSSNKEISPELFIFFADKVAQDGISDLAANLMMDYLVKYTQLQCKKLGISVKKSLPINQSFDLNTLDWTYGRYFLLPENPFKKGEPIVFVPKRFLRASDISKQSIKSKVTGILRSDPALWNKFTRIIEKPINEITIDEIRNILTQDDEALKKFISYLEQQRKTPYDFNKDPLEFLSFKKYFGLLKTTTPMEIDTCDDLLELTKTLISVFKDHNERKDGWKDAWIYDKPIKEDAWGRSLRGLGDAFFISYPDISFLPQTESGNGPVDFCVIYKDCRITIEIKKLANASNKGDPPLPSYLHGIVRQLPEYSINLRARNAFYITGQHYKETRGRNRKNHDHRVNEVRTKIADATNYIRSKISNFNMLYYENIDLSPKPSFSKI